MPEQNGLPRYLNPIFRHEAGENWHPDGVHTDVLGAVLVLDTLLCTRERLPDDPELAKTISYYIERVSLLKRQYGLHEPPPLEDKIV